MRSRSKAAISERKRSPDLIISCDSARSVARVALLKPAAASLIFICKVEPGILHALTVILASYHSSDAGRIDKLQYCENPFRL